MHRRAGLAPLSVMDVASAPDRVAPPRNAGPDWGYAFLRRADRVLPARFFDFCLGIGAWVAVATMPVERRNSRDYLSVVHGRRATWREVRAHFFAFTRMFIQRLRIAEGRPHRCRPLAGCDEFMALMASGRPALLGTFHFGNSDLLGFFLREFRREIFMIRLRMGNSADIDHLAARFAPWVRFIWVNESENLLFALKEAAQSGGSIALKCDRPEHSAKLARNHVAHVTVLRGIRDDLIHKRLPVARCVARGVTDRPV